MLTVSAAPTGDDRHLPVGGIATTRIVHAVRRAQMVDAQAHGADAGEWEVR